MLEMIVRAVTWKPGCFGAVMVSVIMALVVGMLILLALIFPA